MTYNSVRHKTSQLFNYALLLVRFCSGVSSPEESGRELNNNTLHPAPPTLIVDRSALASINKVNQRRARLVLRWETVSGLNSR